MGTAVVVVALVVAGDGVDVGVEKVVNAGDGVCC